MPEECDEACQESLRKLFPALAASLEEAEEAQTETFVMDRGPFSCEVHEMFVVC